MRCMLKNWTSVLRGRFGPHNSIETDKGTSWIKSRHHRAPEPFFRNAGASELTADRPSSILQVKLTWAHLISSLTNPELGCEGMPLERYKGHAVFSKEAKFHFCVWWKTWTGCRLPLSCHLHSQFFTRSWAISSAGYFLKSTCNLLFSLPNCSFA